MKSSPTSPVHDQWNFCPCPSYLHSGQNQPRCMPKYITVNKKFVSEIVMALKHLSARKITEFQGPVPWTKCIDLRVGVSSKIEASYFRSILELYLHSALFWPSRIRSGIWMLLFFYFRVILSLRQKCIDLRVGVSTWSSRIEMCYFRSILKLYSGLAE